jgi:hypothetical protein
VWDELRKQRMAGKTEEKVKQEAKNLSTAYSKYEITKREVISEVEVHLSVKALAGQNGQMTRDQNPIMKMKKLDILTLKKAYEGRA